MPEYQIVLATLGVVVVLKVLVLLVIGGGSLTRLGLAWQVFRRVMGDAAFAAKVQPLLAPPEPAQKPKRSAEPIRLLTILQRESRLLDFLLEDVSGADDAQLGAACARFTRRVRKSSRNMWCWNDHGATGGRQRRSTLRLRPLRDSLDRKRPRRSAVPRRPATPRLAR